MYILSVISFLLLGGFLLLAAMRFGVPEMVSDVYYQLQNCTGSEVIDNKTKHNYGLLFTFVMFFTAITMMMCSCEKFTPEEESSKPIPRENNVTLDLSSKDQVKKACKKVSFGFFKDDAKTGIISQTSDDSDFGAIHLSLAAGTYEVVSIGHNGSGTTISSP